MWSRIHALINFDPGDYWNVTCIGCIGVLFASVNEVQGFVAINFNHRCEREECVFIRFSNCFLLCISISKCVECCFINSCLQLRVLVSCQRVRAHKCCQISSPGSADEIFPQFLCDKYNETLRCLVYVVFWNASLQSGLVGSLKGNTHSLQIGCSRSRYEVTVGSEFALEVIK